MSRGSTGDNSACDQRFVRRAASAISLALASISLAVAAGPTHVGGTIVSSTTWTAANSPYVLDSAITVNPGVTLTIEPDVVVKGAGSNRYILVNGTLTADAQAAGRIYFTSLNDDTVAGDTNGDGSATTPARGDWGGIALRGGSTGLLRNVELRWAGGTDFWYGNYASLHSMTSSLTLAGSTIASGLHEGVMLQSSTTPVLTGNAITGHGGWAIWCNDPDCTRGTFSGNSATDNAVNGIRLAGSLDGGSATWGDGIPYVLESGVGVAAGRTVTVSPGTVVKGFTGSYLEVRGTLVADAAAGPRIHFTSAKDDAVGGDTNNDGNTSLPAAGDWGGVTLRSESVNDVLANLSIRYAGGIDFWYGQYASLHVQTSSLALSASAISDGAAAGLVVGGSKVPSVTGNVFQGNASWAVWLEDVDSSCGTLRSNAANGNGIDAIRVAGTLECSATWEDALVWVLDPGTLDVAAGRTLALVPGTVVKSQSGAGRRFAVSGTLLAAGTAGNPIVFTSLRDDTAGGDTNCDGAATAPGPGDWGGVGFLPGSAGTLSRVEVRYGGALDWWYGQMSALHVASASVTLSDSIVSSSSTIGITVRSGVGPTITGNSFVDNAGWAIWLEDPDSTSGTLYGNSASGNGLNAIRVAGTLDGSAIWQEALPYVLENSLTVGSAGTLSLHPGVIVKAGVSNRYILVYGTLRAEGTPSAKVVFTSYRDDAAGGDTNHDGAATTPAPGDWAGVGYVNPSTNGALLHAEVRYAGGLDWYYGRHASVYLNAAPLTIQDALIAHGAGRGVQAMAGNLQIARTRFEGQAGHDLAFADASGQATITDCPSIGSVYYEGNGPSVAWSGNVFQGWGQIVSRLRAADLGSFSRDNTFEPVPGGYAEVWGGVVSRDDSWSPRAGPFNMLGHLFVQGTDVGDGRTTLTILPGATLRFAPGTGLYVGDGGTLPGELIADGVEAGGGIHTIRMTSSRGFPAAGDWTGVNLRVNGRAELRHVTIAWPATGLTAYGRLGVLSHVAVDRATFGFELVNTVFEGLLDAPVFRNCQVGVRAYNAPATIRNGELIGLSYGVRNDTPAVVVDARQNWWGDPSGPSSVGPGSGSHVTTGVLYDPWLDRPDDDGDGIPLDDGDGVVDPCTAGVAIDCDDNCPEVANTSQDDGDSDGQGDACDTDPTLTVSSDPADGADFDTVQGAVDASVESGTRIAIYPGLGPYRESVRVDRYQALTFVRRDDGTGDPVAIDGGAYPAFYVVNKAGAVPVRIDGLTLRGFAGVQSFVDTEVRDAVLDEITGAALDADGGELRVERASVGPGVPVGLDVAAGASAFVARVSIAGATDAGILVFGTVSLENVLIAGGTGTADGIRLAASGALALRFSTIAHNGGAGIDNAAAGSVAVTTSILFGNGGGDLAGVACGAVSWSDAGSPDCSAMNDNLAVDPLFGVAHVLSAVSPCLDHGPDPTTSDPSPTTDLAGAVRRIDWDGDGWAQSDCGAFEMTNPAHLPEVQGVLWESDYRLTWNVEPRAAEYHVYRDALASLSYAGFGICRDDLDGSRSDTRLDDASTPAPGAGFFYLFTIETATGAEGTLGFAAAAERSNVNRCP